MRRFGTTIAWLATCVIVAIGGILAGRTLAEPADPPAAPASASEYVVIEGAIGRSAAFPISARWQSSPVGLSAAEGTVTSVLLTPGVPVVAGTALYTVDLRPTFVAQGDVPAFRDMALGTKGADVSQLQHLLIDKGYMRGTPDGHFGKTTESAVKKWQREQAIDDDGVVRASDLVFVPSLPARLIGDEELQVGARVEPGSTVVWALSDLPEFFIELGQGAGGALPPAGSEVRIAAASSVWTAVVGVTSLGDEGETMISLTTSDGAPICGAECTTVPATMEATVYSGEVVITPTAEGPIVPVAALATDATGRTFVRTTVGEEVEVRVLADDGGRAVVEGVVVGDRLSLSAPSEENSRTEPSPDDE